MIPHGGRPWPLLFPYLYCGPLCCTNKSPVHTPNLWFLLFCFLVSFFFCFSAGVTTKMDASCRMGCVFSRRRLITKEGNWLLWEKGTARNGNSTDTRRSQGGIKFLFLKTKSKTRQARRKIARGSVTRRMRMVMAILIHKVSNKKTTI
jgi:hypothetical protein